jgi:hypothetical protein
MKSKAFDMALLRDLHTIHMDRWSRHMDRLSLISFTSPISEPRLNSEEGGNWLDHCLWQ